MLTIAVLTLSVSILTQANEAISTLLKFDTFYKDLYPILNGAHLMIILYAMYQLQNIKQLLPETGTKSIDENYKKKAEQFVENIGHWIFDYMGNFYYIEVEKKKQEAFVKKQIKIVNKNINQLYSYWHKVFAWLLIAYVVVFINSLTPYTNEKELLSLLIIFNNVVTVYWFFIYLTLNTPVKTRDDKQYKIVDTINKVIYRLNYYLSLSWAFGKVDDYENSKKTISGWKIIALFLFGIYSGILLFFIFSASIEIENGWYKFIMYTSILFGACSMLAVFSRLSSGFLKVPLSALLIMLFYSAVQPLFFAEDEFKNVDLKSGQLLFIINLICLIGKFALLYIIKWVFSNYRIAYYFINEQIAKNREIKDSDLEKIFRLPDPESDNHTKRRCE
jgi:hypothetical protein